MNEENQILDSIDFLTEQTPEIDPVLDFTDDEAFVAVKLPSAKARTITGRVAIVTSGRRIIPWSEKSFLENDIFPATGCPILIEPRWSAASIRAYQTGAEPPASAEVFHSIRSYLQKYLGFRQPAQYDLVALWIMGSYLKPLFKCYPILFFNAPYESGKSRCLEAVSQLSLNGKWFGEITPAALRRYAEHKITFCLDELKDVGLKNDSPLISILLNAYNAAETVITYPSKGVGWQPLIFKVTSPVAIGNILEIKNEALKSRTIPIRTEYDPHYKSINLPGSFESEPCQIRDQLYRWFLGHWQSVRENYQTYPVIADLSAREMDSYKPLLAIAALISPETVQALTGYAVAVRGDKILARKAGDDRLDLLFFLKAELEVRNMPEEHPVIANRELADAYSRKNHLRLNYRRFMEMVNALHVVEDIKNYSGSKYLVFNRSEIDRQLQLIASKS